MVILQALAGMDGGEHEGAVRAGLQALDTLPQLPQAQKKLPHRRRLIRQREQNVQPGCVAALILEIVSVAHVPHQPRYGGKAGQIGQLGVVGLHRLHFPDLPGLQPAALQQRLKNALILRHSVEQLCDHCLFQLQVQLVVEAEKQISVAVVKSKLQHIGDIPHQRAGEEKALPLAARVGDAPLLQQVNQRQGAVVVAVENGRGLLAALRNFQQVAVLAAVIRQ